MAAEVVTPVDERTGLPLPILMIESSRPERDTWEDYHHHFHPRMSPELQGTDGLAVRYSRGQDLPRWLHQRYHDIFRGPELPQERHVKFTQAILAVAGVIPRQAIDLSQYGSYSIVDMDDLQFMRSASPQRLHFERFGHRGKEVYRRNKIGRFFAEYILEQDISDILSPLITDEFLSTRSSRRRKELGSLMIKAVVTETVADLSPLYQQLKQQGMIQPTGAADLYATVKRFFPKSRFPEYHDALEEKLVS